jgi:hypothetical protein
MDLQAINDEVGNVRSQLRVSWRDFAVFCKAKMMEAAIAGNIASYSIGGRSVTRTLDQWQRWHEYALKQANNEGGGVQMQDISFAPRGNC